MGIDYKSFFVKSNTQSQYSQCSYDCYSLQAETWLNEQAQAMGWAKATKLAGRTALQGLVAVKFDQSHGALVELNCETDFVAKNEKFHQMIEDATAACFKAAHTHLKAKGPITKVISDTCRV